MKIFIASAMRRQNRETRELAMAVWTKLREEYGTDAVYLAPGDDVRPREAFEESAQQIRQADVFVLFCPCGPASPGALVELGLALAWDKHVLSLVRSAGEALPYFLWEGTKKATHLIADRPYEPPPREKAWSAAELYFRFIRAFIQARFELPDGLTDAEVHARLEARMPGLGQQG